MTEDARQTNVTIVDTTSICANFPVQEGRQIQRDNFIYTFEDILNTEIQVLIIEGREEIGKTTVLAQFAKRHAKNTVSVFVRATNRFSYDPTVLLSDLCNQASWLLNAEEMSNDIITDEAILGGYLLQMQRRARRENAIYYFVVDGLGDLTEENVEIRELILNLLPIGTLGFKFLISGAESALKRSLKGVPYNTQRLTGFTLPETRTFLQDNLQDEQAVNELFRTFSGIPGRLASIKRLLESGVNSDTLLDSLPTSVPNLFEMEWRAVQDANEETLEVLALIAHDRTCQTLESLGNMFGLTTDRLLALFRPLNFMRISQEFPHTVTFVSESFRRFAASKLASLFPEVRDKVIAALSRRPESDEALSSLPSYLEEAGLQEKLLEYLSPERLASMPPRSQSLAPVRQKAELGVLTAMALERDADLLRFTIHESSIRDLDGSKVSRSEIEALVVVGEYQTAVQLAQGVTLKIDRLRLLAAVARFQRERGLSPEAELFEQIEQLFKQVDIAEVGEDAVDLAADLMYSRPDLAVQLIDTISAPDSEHRATDWALARLSVEAMLNKHQNLPKFSEGALMVRTRIKDPAALRLSTEISMLMGKYSAAEVIAEVEKLQNVSDKLYMLRRWSASTNDYAGASQVVEYALKVAIASTAFKPTSRDLRELATPLPKVPDTQTIARLVGIFDTQKGLVELSGPTEDFVRLQLILCRAEMRFDMEAARTRLLEVYYYVGEISDLETRAIALARVFASTSEIAIGKKMKDATEVRESTLQELRNILGDLLSSTADHYAVTKNVLKALARREFKNACDIAARLNLEPRRDQALIDIVKTCLRQSLEKIPFETISATLGRFADHNLKDIAILSILQRLRDEPDREELKAVINRALPFIDGVSVISDDERRCLACCLALDLLSNAGEGRFAGLQEKTFKLLETSWEGMDDSWHKVELGFQLVVVLAPQLREAAIEYLARSQTLRDSLGLDYEVDSYVLCVALAIRAFSGLLPNNLPASEDYSRLASRIEQVPSLLTQVRLWTDLALLCFRYEQNKQGTKIVSTHIRPLLNSLQGTHKSEFMSALVFAGPALYFSHQKTAVDQLRELPQPEKDEAFDQVTDFIKRKIPPSYPFDEVGAKLAISFEEAVDICGLLEEIDYDSLLYKNIQELVDSALWRNNPNFFSNTQRLELARRLETLVDKKLPNPRFITHEGFKILSKFQIARLRKQMRGPKWDELIDAIDQVPNISDRVFIIAYVAEIAQEADFLRKALSLSEQIPALVDRIERNILIAEIASNLKPAFAKEILQNTHKLVNRTGIPDVDSLRRKIVDIAHRVDPELAVSLASAFDNDEARLSARRRIQLQATRKDLTDEFELSLDKINKNEFLPRASWMLLGSLNAARVATRPMKHVRTLLQAAAARPLDEAYPILCYVIENTVQRRAHSQEAKSLVRHMFEVTLFGCDFTHAISIRPPRKRATHALVEQVASRDRRIIHPGQRAEALDYIRRWLDETASDYLKLCDPYFGPKDLEILKLVLETVPNIPVFVLTSKKQQDQEHVAQPWSETYRQRWERDFSNQAPPDTEIWVVGTRLGELPIHDRWLITKDNGIRFGSSLDSLGYMKASEISILKEAEAAQNEVETDQYLFRRKREHLGEKLYIESFTL